MYYLLWLREIFFPRIHHTNQLIIYTFSKNYFRLSNWLALSSSWSSSESVITNSTCCWSHEAFFWLFFSLDNIKIKIFSALNLLVVLYLVCCYFLVSFFFILFYSILSGLSFILHSQCIHEGLQVPSHFQFSVSAWFWYIVLTWYFSYKSYFFLSFH